MWAGSQNGTRSIKEPEVTRHCGFINVLNSDGLQVGDAAWNLTECDVLSAVPKGAWSLNNEDKRTLVLRACSRRRAAAD
ncbi:hypothetical protein F4776DRAFT_49284 [Hypoxylon sp. NC0597]|nr:hypothetical protein F4776DRAFT_49284 [Hypoxylon sp. NC0597]